MNTLKGFRTLLAIGIADSATRMAFMTFLPFVLAAKGASLTTMGLALTLTFAGGAFGKLACGLHRRAPRRDTDHHRDQSGDGGAHRHGAGAACDAAFSQYCRCLERC